MSVDASAVAEMVAAAERRTAAEIVVVLAARAHPWWGMRLAVGMLTGGVTLAALCWGPWWVNDLALPGWTIVAAGLGAGIAGQLVTWVPEPRRRAIVRTAARAAFVSEGVHATSGRVGLLVYVAEAEGVVELVPDVGVAALLPPEVIATLSLRPDTLAADVSTLVDRLAPLLPALAGDQNLLPDGPRIHA